MKYVKMIGLAAVAAMALMAITGAGSASATVLCTTNVHENCGAGWDEPSGTVFHMNLTGDAILEDINGNTLFTCTTGTIQGETGTTGGAGVSVTGIINALTWGSAATPCSSTIDTTVLGSLSITAGAGTNGTLSGSLTKFTTAIFGVSCVYGTGAGTTLGTVTGGAEASVDINSVINKQEGGFFCPTTTKWTATYNIDKPKPLYIATN